MSVLVLAEVEVYPEYVDAELMLFERLRTLYASQPGCRSVRLLKHFDDPTRFALATEWDGLEAPAAASRAWAESELMAEALQVVVGTPNLHTHHIVGRLGNTLGSLEPGTVVVIIVAMAQPGMKVETLQVLEGITDAMVVAPGFLGAMTLDDAVVEERVAVVHLWQNYRSCREQAHRFESYKHFVYDLVM